MCHHLRLPCCLGTEGCPMLGCDDISITGHRARRVTGTQGSTRMTESTNVRILDQRTPEERDRPFLPGMGRTWLLPLYDIFTRLVGGRALHGRAVELAGIVPGQAVELATCHSPFSRLIRTSGSPVLTRTKTLCAGPRAKRSAAAYPSLSSRD